MEWIKIPTDEILLSSRSDWQNYALIKYIALYCQLEREPTEIQLSRILNKKQLEYVLGEREVVSELIQSHIEVVSKKRNRDKIHYEKKRNKINSNPKIQLTESCRYDSTEKKRLEKNRLDNIPPTSKDVVPQGELIPVEKKVQRFSKPSLGDVVSYCRERGNLVDPYHFFNFYDANGWRVGKNPMKDWKAAVRYWERTNNVRPAQQISTGPISKSAKITEKNLAYLKSLMEDDNDEQKTI